MNFNEEDLKAAELKGLITTEQFVRLRHFLTLRYGEKLSKQQNNSSLNISNQNKQEKKFTLTNFLYYFGAIMIILPLFGYFGIIWDNSAALLLFSIICSFIFVLGANHLWAKNNKVPGGLLYVCFVSSIPLIVYAFERMIGILPDTTNYGSHHSIHIITRCGWIAIELTTIFTGIYVLNKRKFPHIAIPIAWSLWYLFMDIVPILAGNFKEPTWGQRNFASLAVSATMLIYAYKCDKNPDKKDTYSKWFYRFGATILYFAIISCIIEWIIHICKIQSFQEFPFGVLWYIIAVLSLIYMFIAIMLQRQVFMLWGALGFLLFLQHLAYVIFKDTPVLFHIIMILSGLAIIYFGVWYSKNHKEVIANLREYFLNLMQK